MTDGKKPTDGTPDPRDNIDPARPGASDVPGSPTADSFNLEEMRISQNFVEQAGVIKVLTTIPVGKPDPKAFIRVHPGEDYRMQLALIELKRESIWYLVHPAVATKLMGEVDFCTLFTGITRQGDVFLWPVRLPDAEGRYPSWDRSRWVAAEHAQHAWIRVIWNKGIMAYEILEARMDLPDPVWPPEPYSKLIEIGFRERIITSYDDPLLRRLRGEL
jgi:hypothetical protein